MTLMLGDSDMEHLTICSSCLVPRIYPILLSVLFLVPFTGSPHVRLLFIFCHFSIFQLLFSARERKLRRTWFLRSRTNQPSLYSLGNTERDTFSHLLGRPLTASGIWLHDITTVFCNKMSSQAFVI